MLLNFPYNFPTESVISVKPVLQRNYTPRHFISLTQCIGLALVCIWTHDLLIESPTPYRYAIAVQAITAMPCSTASVTVCSGVCSRSRMRRRAFWRELADATTSAVLRSLHWLPVKQWVDYKLATLVYKSLWGQAPSYLVDDCQLITDSGRPQLHSAHANVLTVPRTNTRLKGISVWRDRGVLVTYSISMRCI